MSSESIRLVEKYLSEKTWRVRENANRVPSIGGTKAFIAETIIARYALSKVYPKEIAQLHKDGFIHIHDLGGALSVYCVGLSLSQLLLDGLYSSAPQTIASRPPRHFSSAMGMITNYMGLLAQEAAGAISLTNVDTLLAPYIAKDKLSYEEVRQALQQFIYSINLTTRWGQESPFTNWMLDLVPPKDLVDTPVIIDDKEFGVYGDFQEEQNMFNEAFLELLMMGDGLGRPFTFPIPTFNITKDMAIDEDLEALLFSVAANYGLPYFQNCVSTDLSPETTRSMCCHLSLNLEEIRQKYGGLWGNSPQTGSIGVITLSLPMIAAHSKSEVEFLELLEEITLKALDALTLKRKIITDLWERGMYPYSRIYLPRAYETFFQTIGVVGGEEMCQILLGEGIRSQAGLEFTKKVLFKIREIEEEYSRKHDVLVNLEETPAEGASFRLARLLLKKAPKNRRYVQGTTKAPYLTNSTHLPVNEDVSLEEALKHQEQLQTIYTGGTVFLIFSEKLAQFNEVRDLVYSICNGYRIPYIAYTPTFSICPTHGYQPGKVQVCPMCGKECLIYSRVVGYYRPVTSWNTGKQQEFIDRKPFDYSEFYKKVPVKKG